MDSLFLPGWGAPPALYASLLPPEWIALSPPSFAASGGVLDAYRTWLGDELFARGRSVVGGHSMGGALALLAAAADPGLVERLVLVSPAGLPLTKPIARSAANFGQQMLRGIYPLGIAARGAGALARAPRAALKLAMAIRSLDLRRECRLIREHHIPAVVIGCKTDTLVRCEDSKRLAESLGADYVELDTPGGHMWMLNAGSRFATILAS